MHNQGTAMFDRPEAGLTSALASVVCPTPASPPELHDAHELADSLSYGELAVALYASDMPTTRADNPGAWQIATWAAQGLDRLGRALVWEIDYRSRRAAGREPEDSALWPSRRRCNTAHGLAHRYHATREDQGRHWPTSATVYVPVQVPDELPETWWVAMYQHDLDAVSRGWLSVPITVPLPDPWPPSTRRPSRPRGSAR